MAQSAGVDPDHLRVFFALAEELHFGRTARRCGLSASRVSQLIAGLERTVGAPLFERTSRRVRLTSLGETFRGCVEPPYRQLLAAVDSVRQPDAEPSGTVRIGLYHPVAGGPHLSEIAAVFERQHPDCRVQLIDTGTTVDTLAPLRRGEVDMITVRRPVDRADIVLGPTLARESRVALMSSEHPLASRASIHYDDLADETLSLNPGIPRDSLDAFIPPLTSDGRRIRRTVTETVNEILMLVARGQLIHPTVESLVDYVRHPGVTAVPIDDLPPSETALAWLRDTTDPRIAAFAATTVAHVERD